MKKYNNPLFEVTLMAEDVILASQFSYDLIGGEKTEDPFVEDFY